MGDTHIVLPGPPEVPMDPGSNSGPHFPGDSRKRALGPQLPHTNPEGSGGRLCRMQALRFQAATGDLFRRCSPGGSLGPASSRRARRPSPENSCSWRLVSVGMAYHRGLGLTFPLPGLGRPLHPSIRDSGGRGGRGCTLLSQPVNAVAVPPGPGWPEMAEHPAEKGGVGGARSQEKGRRPLLPLPPPPQH